MKNASLQNEFSDIALNRQKVEGAYRKFKRHYYYNKNFLFVKKKIADFETNKERMSQILDELASYLSDPLGKWSSKYILSLLDKVDFFVLPKKFNFENQKENQNFISNLIRSKKLESVNFFINVPIEIHILDVIWTLYLAKMSYDEKLLPSCNYGNLFVDSLFFDSDTINFENASLLQPYFYNYSKWRNQAFKVLEKNYDSKKNSILISLDIQRYFYSIQINANFLNSLFAKHPLWDSLHFLTILFNKIAYRHALNIQPFLSTVKANKATVPLPIGLFSSMVLGNLYLKDFDNLVMTESSCSYYGRYVDDMLFVFETEDANRDSLDSILQDFFIKTKLINEKNGDYNIFIKPNLKVQKKKIKILSLSALESRSIIDIYNKTIRIIPSQMTPLPTSETFNLADFESRVYSFGKIGHNSKLSDFGNMDIDSYQIALYFSSLLYKYSNIDSFNESSFTEIDAVLPQIEHLLCGSRCLEFYAIWPDLMSFLVITQRVQQLYKFYSRFKDGIRKLDIGLLQTKKKSLLLLKLKKNFRSWLDICLYMSLSLDWKFVEKPQFKKHQTSVDNFIKSNMFKDSLIALPMANYFEYKQKVSYVRMDMKTLLSSINGKENFSFTSFKFKWSPRFIHLEEIQILLFYWQFYKTKPLMFKNYAEQNLIDKFQELNHIKTQYPIKFDFKSTIVNFNDGNETYNRYALEKISVDSVYDKPSKIVVGIANIKLDVKDVLPESRNKKQWAFLSIERKNKLQNILREMYSYSEKEKSTSCKILVMPELYLPIYWIPLMLKFAQRTQIAIVTGLQYIEGNNSRYHNCVLHIFPFKVGKKGYKNVFTYIREKNDYSPIEQKNLNQRGFNCLDQKDPSYQIFQWQGINIATFVCYEFTDICARSIMKGKCDLIAAPEFNSDTTYFSNIIDTMVRDLHVIIAQANTSIYGDSRVTGPYDRDNRDIFKIKGGENDHVLVGVVDFKKIVAYQEESDQPKPVGFQKIQKEKKPEIKKLPARFQNKRVYSN